MLGRLFFQLFHVDLVSTLDVVDSEAVLNILKSVCDEDREGVTALLASIPWHSGLLRSISTHNSTYE